ncbi:MAG: ubiquinone biosynthesis protein UbiH [Pusillimonas sp.]|nr:ubiquinone biosynthesis protein UbiH [Pusillimonas sp.]|tara:strand:+ start:313808 stop:314980 length:1173 start_codon:yes stop_codon:yes gene_type:complete
MKKTDIAVCGTGIVGLATALGLTRAGFRTILVGPQRVIAPARPHCFGARVYAISPASRHFLESLGVWSLLDASRVTPVEAMQVFGDASGRLELNAWQDAQDVMAWIVESDEIERALTQAVRVFGVEWLNDRFVAFDAPGRICTESGSLIEVDLVVGAEGARSAVREAAHIKSSSRAYDEMGVVTHLHVERPHQNTALQWFTPEGVIAFLPMPNTQAGAQVSLVWSMPKKAAEPLLAMAEDQARNWLTTHLVGLNHELGQVRVAAPVLGFPLFLESSDVISPGVALVGDAAHRVHPLAGQGLNLGLGDVAALLNVLREKPSYQRAGDLRLLARYRRARAEPVFMMRFVTDGLHRLFSSRLPPVVMARNAGLSLVNSVPMLKRQLIKGASRH